MSADKYYVDEDNTLYLDGNIFEYRFGVYIHNGEVHNVPAQIRITPRALPLRKFRNKHPWRFDLYVGSERYITASGEKMWDYKQALRNAIEKKTMNTVRKAAQHQTSSSAFLSSLV